MFSPSESPPRWARVAFTAACALLLGLTHLALFFGEAEFPHLLDLTNNLAAIESGHWFRRGVELWETSMRLGGPLYYWANLPALALGQPVPALHLWIGLLELAGLSAWIWLGTRSRLGAGFSWGGALLLAVYAGPKTVVCENMTLSVILAIPLFASAAAALTRSAWWRWLLPGFLFGFMVQVHNGSLLVGPALLLAMAGEPRRFFPRVLGFAGGWLPLLLIALIKPGAGAAADLPAFLARLAQDLDTVAMLQRAALALSDPLLLLGIALLFSRRVRDGLPSGLLRLALLWLVITDLLLSGILEAIGRDGGAPLQYALVNPARAALAGIALVWLLGLARQLLPSPLSRRIYMPTALVLIALGLAGWRGWQANSNRATFQQEYTAAHKDPCACTVWERRGFSRFTNRYHAALWDKGLPVTASPRVEIAGPMDDNLGAALYWFQRGIPGWRAASRRAMPVTLLASPRLPGLDLGSLPGAKDYGPYFLVPGLNTVEVESRKESLSHQITLSDQPNQGHLLFLVLDGTRRNQEGETAYTLTRGGHPVEPLSSCACTDMSSRLAGWFAYDLNKGKGQGSDLLFKSNGPVVVHHVTAGTIKR